MALGDKAHPDDALEWFAALSKLPPAPSQPPPAREALIELFDRVKFHPLSIRVLAQQLKTRRPAELGERLGQLLADPALQAAARKIDDTPAGLFASLQLSLEKLDAKARAVLPRLGVFQGGAFENHLLDVTGLNPADERAHLTALLAAVESGDVRTILRAMGQDVEGDLPPEVVAAITADIPRAKADLRQELAALPQAADNLWPELRRQLAAAALLEAERVDGVGVPYLRFHPTLAPLLWEQLPADERTRHAAAHRQRYAALARYLYPRGAHDRPRHQRPRRSPAGAHPAASRHAPARLRFRPPRRRAGPPARWGARCGGALRRSPLRPLHAHRIHPRSPRESGRAPAVDAAGGGASARTRPRSGDLQSPNQYPPRDGERFFAVAGTSANSNGVATLDDPFSNDPPTLADIETLRVKLNELIASLRR